MTCNGLIISLLLWPTQLLQDSTVQLTMGPCHQDLCLTIVTTTDRVWLDLRWPPMDRITQEWNLWVTKSINRLTPGEKNQHFRWAVVLPPRFKANTLPAQSPGFPEGTWLLIAILILKRSSLQPLQFCLQPQAGPTLQAGILKVKLNQAHLSSTSTPQIDMAFLGVDSPSLRAGVTAFTREVLLVVAPEERLLYPDQVSWWWATVLLVGWKPFGSQPWMSNSLVKGTLLLNTCQQKIN